MCIWPNSFAHSIHAPAHTRPQAHERGELKGDVAISTQRYGEPDRVDVFTLLEHDLEELQKLFNTTMLLGMVTMGAYAYIGNVTVLVVQVCTRRSA